MLPRETIATAQIPEGGELTLVSHGRDFIIMLGRDELMGTRMQYSEEQLALLTLAELGKDAPRLVEIFGIGIEADLDGHMLYVVNDDKPGFIGRIGTLLGSKGINIGIFNLGRRDAGGEAVLLLSLDDEPSADVLAEAEKVEGVKMVKALSF